MQYNFYDDICCSGVITTGIVGFNKDYFESYGTACCGTVGYDINDGLCCDGTVNTGLSAFNSDTCPSGLYVNDMSIVMRKSAFGICENKDADQLRRYCAADQRLCFRYTDSTIPLLYKSEISCL